MEDSRKKLQWLTRPDVLCPLLLTLSWLLFFSDPLFTTKNFYYRDILNFHYPMHKVLIESYARGEFPLWNPYLYLGQPMLANLNYLAFYPSNLFHAVFSFDYAFKLHFIIHPLLGGLGAWFLQRRLGIVPIGSLGGSIAYQFSGPVLSFLNLYTLAPAVALIPWSGWAYLGLLRECGARRVILFGVIQALQFISFEPLLFQCNVIFLAGLAIFHVIASELRVRALLRALTLGFAGMAFGLALAMVQILPTLELLPLSVRGGGFEYELFSAWSMHPMDVLNFFIPNLFGDPYTIEQATYWGEKFHRGREGYLVSFFLGSSTCFLALLATQSTRKTLKWVMGSVTLVALLLGLGEYNPSFRWLFEHVAVFRIVRYPSKYLLLGALSLAILAGMGIEIVSQSRSLRWRQRGLRILLVIGGVLGSGLLGSWLWMSVNPQQPEVWIRAMLDPSLAAHKDLTALALGLMGGVRTAAVFLLLTVLLAASALFSGRLRAGASLLVLLIGAELMPANLRLFPLIAEEDLKFVSEVLHYLRTNFPNPVRVAPTALTGMAPDQQILAPNQSMVWLHRLNRLRGDPLYGIALGVQYSLDKSVDGLNTRQSQEIWESCMNLPVPERLTLLARLNSPVILSFSAIEDSRLRFLKTFDTRSENELKLYWLENTVARAFFVSAVMDSSTPAQALRYLLDPNVPYGDIAVVEGRGKAGETSAAGTGRVEVLEYENQRILCNVAADVRGYIVLLDNYYPGWRAYVEGREAPVWRANYAFRAVEVPAGRHRVEFRYEPRSFYYGLAVTCSAMVFGILLGFSGALSSMVIRLKRLAGRFVGYLM